MSCDDRAILDRQTDAWNRHDMDAFVADTMPDVEWINVVGMLGRDVTLCAGSTQCCTRACLRIVACFRPSKAKCGRLHRML